jgi:hypothetical protein
MANRGDKNVVVGVFESRSPAEHAMLELCRVGFDDDEIGMLARDTEGKLVRPGVRRTESATEEGAAVGAVVGAAGGAALGAAVLTGLIPAIGPVLAVGTLGALLVNAAGGAVVGLVAGALIGWGIPEEEAEYYETEVKAGRYLVTVDASGERAGEARAILDKHRGFDRAGWDVARAGPAPAVEVPTDQAEAINRRPPP